MGWADALSGLGAGLAGRGTEWQNSFTQAQKQQAEMEEKRRAAMALDFRNGMRLLEAGNIGGFQSLMNERMAAGEKLGADMTHTGNLSMMVMNGDVQGAIDKLKQSDQAAVQDGILPSMTPKYTNIQDLADGGKAGLNGTTGQYERIPTPEGMTFAPSASSAGATMYSAGDRVMDNGTTIRTSRSGGPPEVYAPNGEQITDPAQREAILRKAREEEVLFAQGKSRATAVGKKEGEGTAGRVQEIIGMGMEAARAMPILKRTRYLLDEVKTGGWNAAKIKIKTLLGVSGADEVELSSSMGKAVLSQLRETFGAAFTEKEGAKLDFIEANLGKSTAGNVRLINQLIKMGELKAEKGYEAALKSGDTDSAQYILDMQNFTLDDSDTIGRPTGATAAPPASTTQPRFLGFE